MCSIAQQRGDRFMNYWLMKSEPEVFGIDDLKAMPKQTDLVFFYHSNCKEPGIVGIAKVVKEGYPDFTAWDPKQKYYDEKSDPENPRWFMVDVKFKRKFKRTITLEELKQVKTLKDMPLVRRGNRLSIMPVTTKQWKVVLSLE